MVTRSGTLACLLLPLLVSCAAKRSLRITTEPPGAEVRMDGETIGRTPLRMDFDHYGVRRVTLYSPGYVTHSERIELDPPWYARFPFDIFSEVLLPIGWKDRRKFHVDLIEGSNLVGIPTLRSVIERAGVFRHAGPEGPTELPEPVPATVPEQEQEESEGGS